MLCRKLYLRKNKYFAFCLKNTFGLKNHKIILIFDYHFRFQLLNTYTANLGKRKANFICQ